MPKRSSRSSRAPHLRLPRYLVVLLILVVLYLLVWVVSAKLPLWLASPSAAPTTKTVHPVLRHAAYVDSLLKRPRRKLRLRNELGEPIVHKVKRLPDFGDAFPDLNPVQLETATRIGIRPCRDRDEAQRRSGELVLIGDNRFYRVNALGHSVPYLVPRAARLLEEIGRVFQDSLAIKGKPFHQLVVTSVLRTDEDIARLKQSNRNASSQSCHRFGTTFDIAYTKFQRPLGKGGEVLPISDPYELKLILGEVLRDLRAQGLCYVRYEVKQACFHITAR